ncbi:hypothetical protein GCM10020254_03310 [Streptomyces goshikiensis]
MGGISGLGAALMLGRRGHAVTLFEQDARKAGEDLDGDFFRWQRPRIPQAVQPHSFLAPVRSVLRAETPDVYADLLARGPGSTTISTGSVSTRRTGRAMRSW